jgi:hypothetical protein
MGASLCLCKSSQQQKLHKCARHKDKQKRLGLKFVCIRWFLHIFSLFLLSLGFFLGLKGGEGFSFILVRV